MNAIKVAGVMFGGIILIFVLFAGAVPMLMQAVDHTKLHNVNFAIDYLSGESYEVYALPPNPAQGQVLYYNGANWAALNPGTSGYFLQTQGPGINPAWATATHLGLSDTPAGFAGSEGKILRVNTTPDAVEYTNLGVITVAASDSTASAKAAALASGGGICDGSGGTCDGAIVDAADDLATLTGSSVRAAAGTYYFESADYTFTSTIWGEPSAGKWNETTVGTVFVLSSGRHIILHYPGDIRNIVVDNSGNTDYIVKMEVISGLTDYNGCDGLLDGLRIDGNGSNCIGLYLYANATDSDSAITLSNFGPFKISFVDVGLQMEAVESGGHNGFINGINISQAQFRGCRDKFIYLKAGSGAAVDGNIFSATQIQKEGSFNQAIYFENTAENQFPSCNMFDLATNDIAIYADADSHYNYVRGFGAKWARTTDLGKWNDFYTHNQHTEYFTLMPEGGHGKLFPATTSPSGNATQLEYGTNDVDIWYLPFDKTTQEYAVARFILPKGYDYNNAKVKFQFGWTMEAGATGTVVWGAQAIVVGNIENYDSEWSTAVEVTDTMVGGATGHRHTSDWTDALTPTNLGNGGEELIIRIYRKQGTLDRDALLTSVTVALMVS